MDIDPEEIETISSNKRQLEVGDRFVATTMTEYDQREQGPSWSKPTDRCAIVRNPVGNDPFWLRVNGANPDTEYLLEVNNEYEGIVDCVILETDDDLDNTPPRFKKVRDEGIEWEGTPQGEPDQSHNRVVSEEDVRGSKNDSTKGLR